MKKVIVSFGGIQQGVTRHCDPTRDGLVRNYTREVERLFTSAKPYGFDEYQMYDDVWLRQSRHCTSESIRVINEPSFGWMFKPAAIAAALSTMSDGDLLMWMDSNDILVGDPSALFSYVNSYWPGIYCHEHGHTDFPNKEWTHRDMFVRMKCDEEKYWNARQVQVDFMVFRKCPFVTAFVSEWLSYASDYSTMIGEGKYENLPEFKDHRHEQSIFTLLKVKYGIHAQWHLPHSWILHQDGIVEKLI